MLITFQQLITHFKPDITGILHVGAHDCEEKSAYNQFNINDDNIYWVDAMPEKIVSNKQKYGEQLNIYQGVIDEEDDKTVDFHITNNGESSSILTFGSHETHHPHVKVISTRRMTTTRLDTLFEQYQIPIEKINFLNLDIQGVELRALKSMEKHLHHIKYIYTEVNTEQVYKGCAQMSEIDEYLSTFGFQRAATHILQYGWGDAFYIKA
jgi:FkbM family methyltransferase